MKGLWCSSAQKGSGEREHEMSHSILPKNDGTRQEISPREAQLPSSHARTSSYRRRAAAAVERHLLPGDNEDPEGREGGHVPEVPADVPGGPVEQLWLCALPVVDVPTDAIVHVGPKGRHEGAAVGQREGLGCELAHQGVEGDHTVVVDLRGDPHFEQNRINQRGAAGLSRKCRGEGIWVYTQFDHAGADSASS